MSIMILSKFSRALGVGPIVAPHPIARSRSIFQSHILRGAPPVQSISPLAPIGVKAAIQGSNDSGIPARPKIFDEFSLKDRVGVVSGANRGLGLEMALV